MIFCCNHEGFLSWVKIDRAQHLLWFTIHLFDHVLCHLCVYVYMFNKDAKISYSTRSAHLLRAALCLLKCSRKCALPWLLLLALHMLTPPRIPLLLSFCVWVCARAWSQTHATIILEQLDLVSLTTHTHHTPHIPHTTHFFTTTRFVLKDPAVSYDTTQKCGLRNSRRKHIDHSSLRRRRDSHSARAQCVCTVLACLLSCLLAC